MVLKLVISGYFRTGTTLLYLGFKRDDWYCLYEPEHEDIKKHARESVVFVEPHQPLRFNPWSDYFKLPEDVKEEMLNRVVTGPVIDFKKVKGFLDYLDALELPIMIKVNRWSFILKDIVDNYDTKVIHITRNIHDVITSHLRVYARTMDENVFFNKTYYEFVKKHFDVPDARSMKERIAINCWLSDYYAKKSGAIIVRYEDVPYIDFKKLVGYDFDKSVIVKKEGIKVVYKDVDEIIKTLESKYSNGDR